MKYEAPTLEGPAELYETPMLLDVADVSAAELGLCATGGSCEIEQQM